ncbi:MAG TPA: hypothetical protein VJ023_03495 [Pyrinomonadaceae bacterium]|nr:hypothetical protein [Pyrinomonadaceae bacterium]
MTTTDSVFQRAVVNMLAEIADGPPGHEAYLLKGDLFRQPDLALTLRRLQTNGPDEF